MVIWDLNLMLQQNDLLGRMGKKNTFITDTLEKPVFGDELITEITVLKCHSGLISSIAVLEKPKAFATASFDCCVHVWSL